ncbi:activator of 90 kDa heat shock protein ATPase [Pseudoscourfieldia marina]
MAKWGEGDERWIVSERQDGQNINGWHWQEKCVLPYFRERIASELVGLKPSESECLAAAATPTITDLKELTGEASLTIRKGNKKFAYYDVTIVLNWKGKKQKPTPSTSEENKDDDDDDLVQGTIKITEFAEGNDEDDYTFAVTVEGKGNDRVKRAIATLKKDIFDRLGEFLNAMKKELCS